MIKIISTGTKLIVLSILFSFFFINSAEAKVLPQAKGIGQKSNTVARNVAGTGINVFPKLRGDRRALIVNFANLQNAINVSYLLTYKQSLPSSDGKTSTQDEGVMGSLPLGGSSTAASELLFGTCSKNVCRYHTGVKDARLDVTYTSKAGKKYLKRYKIKV